ncbi:hypothetical protein NIES2104_20710 [Leptolyngbya sp. NIES-2104]|nr:hypothetical protein NIES2104_20710 [Leptolyngbya sp. NIES-2104]
MVRLHITLLPRKVRVRLNQPDSATVERLVRSSFPFRLSMSLL